MRRRVSRIRCPRLVGTWRVEVARTLRQWLYEAGERPRKEEPHLRRALRSLSYRITPSMIHTSVLGITESASWEYSVIFDNGHELVLQLKDGPSTRLWHLVFDGEDNFFEFNRNFTYFKRAHAQ